MSEQHAGTQNRLRLWLRAERAFGLNAVPVRRVEESPESIPAAVAPASVTSPRVAPVSTFRKEPAMAKPVGKTEPMLIDPSLTSGFSAPPLPRDEKIARLAEMDANEVKGCTRCRLCQTRTNTVFGEGDADAKIFFVGEGPGENEDLSGRPFVGRAGQLLDKMIGGMGLRREQVFIANIVKCRPPNNRVPGTDEVATCTPYLERQIEIVRPRVIVTLGRPSTSYMLDTKLPMNRLRGEWQTWRGIKLMPTFHPAYVLRSYTDEVRAAVWSDLKKVLVELGMPVPKRGA